MLCHIKEKKDLTIENKECFTKDFQLKWKILRIVGNPVRYIDDGTKKSKMLY